MPWLRIASFRTGTRFSGAPTLSWRTRVNCGCGSSPSPRISLLVSTTFTANPSTSPLIRMASRRKVVLPLAGFPQMPMPLALRITSRNGSAGPRSSRPNRRVMRSSRPLSFLPPLTRWLVPGMPLRPLLLKEFTAPSMRSMSSNVAVRGWAMCMPRCRNCTGFPASILISSSSYRNGAAYSATSAGRSGRTRWYSSLRVTSVTYT